VRRRALLVLPIVLLAAGCGSGPSGSFEPAQAGTLTVMTQPLPTAGFWEGTGARPTGGLEYAMARELARRLDLDRVVVHTEPFSKIVGGDLGDADLALALITPTEQRDKVLDFSTPYIHAAPALVTRVGTSVPDVQTAQELQFATEASTTLEQIVGDVIRPDTPPHQYPNEQDKLRAIRSGKADVGLFDLPAAQAIAHADPDLEVAAKLSKTEPIAAALPQGSDNVEAVSAALRAMQSDGTLDRLAERWLGRSLTDSDEQVPLLRTDQP
jgi:glutamine transport system substrate-binding protein